MAWNKFLSAVVAPVTPQQLGEMAAQDPTSFLGQKVVAVELQQPGLQFFSSPEQAAGTTQAVLDHLQSPSAMDQVAPFFATSLYTAPIYAAYRIGQNDQGDAVAQLRARIEEAKRWATSSAGSAIQQAISGAESRLPQADFGTMLPGFSDRVMPMFSMNRYQDSISAVLDSIRGASWTNSFRRLGQRTRFLRRAVLTVEDL